MARRQIHAFSVGNPASRLSIFCKQGEFLTEIAAIRAPPLNFVTSAPLTAAAAAKALD